MKTRSERLYEQRHTHGEGLEEWTREQLPLDRAGTPMNLGAALRVLGDRETGTSWLEEGVAAYRLVLEEWTREQLPLDWAGTQMNLGTALQVLAIERLGRRRWRTQWRRTKRA